MGKPNVKPLRTERPPLHPVPRITATPPGATEHKVKLGEDWHTLAWQYGFNEIDLMDYNFGTTDPAEVNWYLREYVGCVLPDQRGLNWKFSNNLHSGNIYIPPRTYDFNSQEDPTELVTGKPPFLKVDWAKNLADPSGAPHVPHGKILSLEISHLIVAALEIAGWHVVGLQIGVLVAPLAAQVAVLAAIGGAYLDAAAMRPKLKQGTVMLWESS